VPRVCVDPDSRQSGEACTVQGSGVLVLRCKIHVGNVAGPELKCLVPDVCDVTTSYLQSFREKGQEMRAVLGVK